ncbi:GNAT family N-acetyltransferase [Gloeobacter violaceus]|uniref:Gll3462 protein n=1 Tax=Gloeobacter violaceus (strain ATCC 29082 / PCC 7421) TaxID=251221 RepID=Q7NFR2_GLOVI|nr:GNAT family N-acetyltransferase [Gloeobacter violaceus]BAC91403.1 gll3462 [Gloeobacter violaceus PCC 7421]
MTSDAFLRDTTEDDLPIFFEQQLDPDANYMAAFTSGDPTDRDHFMARWTRIFEDDAIATQTILCDGHVAGYVASFEQFGKPSISYWLGKEYWGKGFATKAVLGFVGHINTRPLYARAAKDNIASIRVLEKCGFTICGEDKGFANARGEQVEEFIMRLGAS